MTEIMPGAPAPGEGGPPRRPPGPAPAGYIPVSYPSSPTGIAPSQGPVEASLVPPVTKRLAWRWLFYAVVGFLVGQIAGGIFGLVAGAAEGKTSAQLSAIAQSSVPPEWYVISTLLGIWVGFVGAPWLASRTAGTKRFWRDLGVRFRPVDAIGLAVGPLCQLGVAILYAPFQHDIHNYNAPTTKLTGASHGGGIVLIVLATALLAPVAEELFFRGLVFRALVRLCTSVRSGPGTARTTGLVVAIVVDGLLFGLAHGEWVQLAGLALLGVVLATMTYRTGRLGMNMVTHASFNLVAVLSVYGVIR